jgi:pyrrolidone-carboxylate peptidase
MGYVNPSFPSISLLPSKVEISGAEVEVIVYPRPVQTAYGPVLATFAEIYENYPRPDLVIHVGLAPTMKGYRIETQARKHGYKHPGVDGKLLTEEQITAAGWDETPEVLLTGVAVKEVVKRWIEFAGVS